jgi:hypothetical protein
VTPLQLQPELLWQMVTTTAPALVTPLTRPHHRSRGGHTVTVTVTVTMTVTMTVTVTVTVTEMDHRIRRSRRRYRSTTASD